ncbi:MAG TPA: bifunctional oligoribonuclease/PAP phosphatase NrnA [Candidatus Blautia pullicola]|uniref:Bifunctional oligoribonuclease/PAP phosphatase NrnA n=1 Tax=Candidatus Blautia pullicola TaxID=2838498 RepID=A0A9D2FT01_9FIRM|nr:bifunctional oligoribonuclease/PAP phosphatase NrnA [Candidatus Blautia pullicola]
MEKITSELNNVKTVAIAGHIRPDGDCVGACMGLYLYLKENYPEIETDVYLEEPKEGFSFLSGFREIKTVYDESKTYDVFFVLDTSVKNRIGVALAGYESAGRTICIDHHISNKGFGDKNVIRPQVSSASELVYTLLEEDKVTKPVAEALYMGIIHDTGVFQYSCTTPETMAIGAKLMEMGIDFSKIVDKTFYEKSYVQNQILGRCLMESIMVLDGKCIVGSVKKRDMDFYGVVPKDLDGIVQQLRVTKGVEVAIFLYEVKTQEFKVSLRSNGPVDVNAIASYFGGGGHVKAAGCTMQGSVYDVINNLTLPIEKQLKERCEA